MQATMCADKSKCDDTFDEELHDVLIAISVVAKRLAKKVEVMSKEEKQKEDT